MFVHTNRTRSPRKYREMKGTARAAVAVSVVVVVVVVVVRVAVVVVIASRATGQLMVRR